MKMVLEISLLTVAVIILVYLSFHFIGNILPQASKQNSQNQVCFGSHCFFVEIAKTPAEREKGLMNRSELDKDKGMFFIFDKEGIYPFWMENTLIPLDMIWIDINNKVVFIGSDIQPCKSLICPSVVPTGVARYVLEVNTGICKGISLKIGDQLNININ